MVKVQFRGPKLDKEIEGTEDSMQVRFFKVSLIRSPKLHLYHYHLSTP